MRWSLNSTYLTFWHGNLYNGQNRTDFLLRIEMKLHWIEEEWEGIMTVPPTSSWLTFHIISISMDDPNTSEGLPSRVAALSFQQTRLTGTFLSSLVSNDENCRRWGYCRKENRKCWKSGSFGASKFSGSIGGLQALAYAFLTHFKEMKSGRNR